MKSPRKKILGVAAVVAAVLLLLVAGCKSNQPAPRTDQQIAADVQAKIKGEQALANQNIQADVKDGVATLSGTVSDEASRALAGNDSGSINGVKTVVNNLTVQPAQQAVTPPEPAPLPTAAPAPREKKSRHEHGTSQPLPAPQPVQPPVQVAQAPPVAPPPVPKAPPAPPKPTTKQVTIPAGTWLPVRITETLDSATAQQNQAFHGALASDLGIQGVIAIPRGTSVTGRIVDVKEAAHFKGQALLSVELTEVDPRGQRVSIGTSAYTKQGAARGKNTAEKAGGGALLGALIGGLAGGGKGAAIGAAAGAGAGAGVNAITRGQQAVIPTETVVNFQLNSPITLTVPLSASVDQNYDNRGDSSDPELLRR